MKLISKLLVCLVLLTIGFGVYALSLTPKLYVGADTSMQVFGVKHQETVARQDRYLPSLNVYGGLKANEFVGVEVGTVLQKSKNLSGTRFSSNTYHGTVIGTLPVSEGLNALGGVGVSHIRYSAKTSAETLKFNKTVPRFVGGVEYLLFPYTHLRATVIYQHTDSLKVGNTQPNDSCFGSIGINYSF